jgi:hypothetical protein
MSTSVNSRRQVLVRILFLSIDVKVAWCRLQTCLIDTFSLQLGQTILQYETATDRVMIDSILQYNYVRFGNMT